MSAPYELSGKNSFWFSIMLLFRGWSTRISSFHESTARSSGRAEGVPSKTPTGKGREAERDVAGSVDCARERTDGPDDSTE
jgi:hypothetical protein